MASNTVKMVLSLKDNASKTLRKTGKEADAASRAFSAAKVGVGALAVATVAAGAAFVKMAKDVADTVNEIGDFSAVTGLSAQSVQALKLAARSTGLELGTMQRAMVTLSRNVSEAKDNIESAQAEAFSKLGLDPEAFKNADDALFQVLERLRSVEDQFDKTAIANDLFGGGAQRVLQMLQRDFGAVTQVVGTTGGAIRNATADAGDMQASLALFEATTDNLKVAFFESFGGKNGLAGGLALASGLIKGLGQLVSDLYNAVAKQFEFLGYAVNMMYQYATGNIDQAQSYARKGRQAMIDASQAIVNIYTGKFFEEGVKAYQAFDESMELLTRNAEKQTDVAGGLAGEHDKLSGAISNTGRSAASAANKIDHLKDALAGVKSSAEQSFSAQGLGSIPGLVSEQMTRLLASANQAGSAEFGYAEVFAQDIERAFNAAASALGKDETSLGHKMLQQLFGAAAGEFKVVAGVITDEFIEADNELTKLQKKLKQTATQIERDSPELLASPDLQQFEDIIGVTAAKENLEILEQTIRSYNELAMMQRSIHQQEEKSLETVKDYEAAIADAEDSLDKNFDVYKDTAAALLELIELQSRTDIADNTGASLLYDQIAEKFGFKAAATFQGDLDKALVGSIKELKGRLEGMGLNISEQIIDVEKLQETLEGMQVELDLKEQKLKVKELRVERMQALETAITSITGVAATLGQGDIFGGVAQAGAATGTPQGAVVSAVFSGLSQFVAMGELAKDSSVQEVSEGLVKTAEQQIEAFELGMDVFKEVLPDILTLIVTELPFAILKAVPDIVTGIYVGVAQALADFWNSIKGLFGRTKEEKEADRQEIQEYWANWFNDIVDDLPTYNSGTGYVSRTGLALLHQGESVVPVNGRPQQGAMGAGAPVNINISASMIDRDVIPRLVREIEKVTGRFGRMQASFA